MWIRLLALKQKTHKRERNKLIHLINKYLVYIYQVQVLFQMLRIYQRTTQRHPHGAYILVMGDRQKYKKVSIVPEMIQAIGKR